MGNKGAEQITRIHAQVELRLRCSHIPLVHHVAYLLHSLFGAVTSILTHIFDILVTQYIKVLGNNFTHIFVKIFCL